MQIRLFTKLALAMTFWLPLHISALRAQIFTNDLPLQANTTGTNPVDFEFRADGTLISKGNLGVGSLTTPDQGDGTRMLWSPSLAALRAGGASSGSSVGSGPWDSAQIGQYSVAFGLNTTASGQYSTALGYSTQATGEGSTVIGEGSHADGDATFAAGLYSGAEGYDSRVMGYVSAAMGDHSTAIGFYVISNGSASIAMGAYSTTGNDDAMATGLSTTASGYASFTGNIMTTASGDGSAAFGYNTTAAAGASFAVGAYNVGGGDPSNWIATDPIFEVGNGSSEATSDALVVYKDGNAAFQGSVTVAPGGDIPMYTGE